MRTIINTLMLLVFALTTGCASIVSGQNQSLSVKTIDSGEALAGANCELNNDKGTWFVTTPGSVSVRRSYNELNVKCEKDGLDPGSLSVASGTKAMAFGNILFGGVIGAGVDISTGAAYDYPSLITISMGEMITIKPQPADDNEDQNNEDQDNEDQDNTNEEKKLDVSASNID